jgi:hypothetical protein
MDDLVWLLLVPFRGLTRAQKRKNSVGEIQLHDVLYRKPAVFQQESAEKRIGFLNTMRSQMEDVRRLCLKHFPDLSECGVVRDSVVNLRGCRLEAQLCYTHFIRHIWKVAATRRCLADQQAGYVVASDGLESRPGRCQRGQCWDV